MQKDKESSDLVEKLQKSSVFNNVSEQTMFLIVRELSIIKAIPPTNVKLCEISKKSLYKNSIKSKPVKNTNYHSEFCQDLLKTCDITLEKLNKIGEQFNLESDGLYIILEGKCVIRNQRDLNIISQIQFPDFFGESEIFGTVGYNFFGEIISAGSTELKCLFIDKEKFKKIPEFEQKKMKENCSRINTNLTKLVFQCCERYGGNPYEIINH